MVLGVFLDFVYLCEINIYFVLNIVELGGSFVVDINGGVVKVFICRFINYFLWKCIVSL